MNERIKRLFQRMRIIDNAIMRSVFNGDTECAKELLRPILGLEDLQIVESKVEQTIYSNPPYKDVRLDVLAVGNDGAQYDIEFQRAPKNDIIYRASFNAALVKTRALEQGEEYAKGRWTYVIFIMETDYCKMGLPLYQFKRVSDFDPDYYVDDRESIILVNCKYKNESTELGRIIHDIVCENSEEMYNKTLAKRVEGVKCECQKEGGSPAMKKEATFHEIEEEILAEGRAEGHAEGVNSVIATLLRDGTLTPEAASEKFGIPMEKLRELVAN